MTARWSRRPLFFPRPAPPFSRTHSPTTLASRHCLLRLMIQATGTLSKENAAPLTTMASAKAVGGAGAGAGAPAVPALRVKKLHPDAVMPKRGSSGAAGYDLARCVERVGARGACAARPRVRAASQPNFRPRARFFFFASNRPALSTLSLSLSPLHTAAPTSPSRRTAGPSSPLAWPWPPRPGPTPASPRGRAWPSSTSSTRARASWTRTTGARSASSCSTMGRPPLKVCIVRDGRRALTREEGLLGTRPACVWAAVHATVSLIKTFLSLSLSFPFFLHSQAWRPGRPAHPGAHRHAGGGRGG